MPTIFTDFCLQSPLWLFYFGIVYFETGKKISLDEMNINNQWNDLDLVFCDLYDI